VLTNLLLLAGAASAIPHIPGTVLKTAAFPKYFGAALGQGHLQNASDPKFAEFAAIQFSGATPENEMKWQIIEPFQNQFNFTPGDFIVKFGKEHSYTHIRGHTLVWHNQLAPWAMDLPNDTAIVTEAMTNHITKVMEHYRGQLYAWDVVNEALNDDGTLSINDPFAEALGASYIELAYQTARKADPTVKLYYNDFNTEGINNKSDALLEIVKGLKSKGLIDGVGFQCHFIIGEVPTDLAANFKRFNEAGVEVAITELDLRTTLPVDEATVQQQAKDYQTVVDACESAPNCVGITTWGITDLYSWIPGTFPGQGFGLLFDDSYNEKPSFFSTINALNAG